MSKGSRRLVLAAAAALSITCCSLTPTTTIVTMAQVTPDAVHSTAWARSGSDFLIQGGYVSLNGVSQYVSSQFFALDLSKNWPVASPPWRALSNGTVSRSFYGVALPTNQTFLTFNYVEPTTYTITAYNVASNTWELPRTVTTGSVSDILSYGLKPVVDPTSGLVYIAGIAGMNIYNPTSQTWDSRPILTGTLTARYFASPGYNTARKTIMYAGGYNYGVSPTHFDPVVVVTEYSPATNTWSVLPTSGTAPSPRADHCSAISDDGKTLVIFGGRTSILTPNTFTGSIHILDITTGVWTSGLPEAATPRIYTACVLVGDQFVSWAGSTNGNDTILSPQPIVFDVTLKKWVDSYKAPAYYLDNPPPKRPTPSSGSGNNGGGSGSGGGAGSGNSSNNGDGPGSGSDSKSGGLALIIGCVAGGLALVVAIVGFLWYRRRQNRKLNDIKEQVSLQRMVIEAERSNKPVVSNNNNHRNDGDGGAGSTFTRNNGGGGGDGYTSSNSGGNDNFSTTVTYPTPPVYLPNNKNSYSSNNTASPQSDIKASLSPKSPYQTEFSVAPSSPIVTYPMAISSPVMSTSAATTSSPANSNNYYNYSDINYNSNSNTINGNNSPHGPQSTLSKTSGPQALQVIGGPQEYYSPSGRAPQMFGNGRGDLDAYYHEQESSGRRRQNHPQEGHQFY